jgi:putative nucleotidyltransferase with HDIG domain
MASTRTRYRSYERTLLLQFSLVGFAVTLGMAAVLGYLLQRQLVSGALLSATEAAATQVTAVVRPSITTTDLASPFSAPLHARLDEVAARTFEAGGIVRIKIWNHDGVIIYSDDDAEIGLRGAPDAVLDEALAGVTSSKLTDLSEPEHGAERKWGSLLEVFVPLRAIDSDRVVGAYEVYHTTTDLDQSVGEIKRTIALGVFGGFGVLYFALFGVVLGAARRLIDRARENRRLTEEVTNAYDDAIEGWGRALDLKDHETEGHSQRVTELAVEIAREWGMSSAEIVMVRRGAALHDIGKMGVPDEILKKAGPLTEEEWVLMRAHTVYARDMLAGLGLLGKILDIPVHHHERWDGAGYPDGLAGEDIPRAARLFAVVDVWDALTNDRPYRRAWSTEDALAHVKEAAGSHFDPAAVDVFLEVMRARAAETDEDR